MIDIFRGVEFGKQVEAHGAKWVVLQQLGDGMFSDRSKNYYLAVREQEGGQVKFPDTPQVIMVVKDDKPNP